MDRAACALLVRTSARGHRPQFRRAKLRRQVRQFRRRDVEPVVVGGEITAGPARLAVAGPGRLLLGVSPRSSRKAPLLLRGAGGASRALPPWSILSDSLDVFARVEPAAIDPRAPQGGPVPRLRAGQILRPKRPTAALGRPDRIDRALPRAPERPQKDAVLGEAMLDDRGAHSHPAQESAPQFLRRDFQVLGDQLDLRLGHPDIPLPRPRAAPPAHHALKVQPRRIPFCRSYLVSHNCYSISSRGRCFNPYSNHATAVLRSVLLSDSQEPRRLTVL